MNEEVAAAGHSITAETDVWSENLLYNAVLYMFLLQRHQMIRQSSQLSLKYYKVRMGVSKNRAINTQLKMLLQESQFLHPLSSANVVLGQSGSWQSRVFPLFGNTTPVRPEGS